MQDDNLSREDLLAELYELRRRVAESEAQETRTRRWVELVERVNALKEDLLARGSLDEKVKRITDGLVKIFGCDFARIWVTKPGDRCDSGCVHAKVTEGPHLCRQRNRCLHLMASSGRYTHIDGEVHRRVPFDCYKIGRVASGSEKKFLTNDVANDLRIHDQGWARELGLVSFAGYRLLSDDSKPIGVMALFSKHSISPDEETMLEDMANTTSQVVHAALVDEAQRESEAKYRAIFLGASEGILVADPLTAEFKYANPVVCDMLGYTEDELTGLSVSAIHPKETLEYEIAWFQAIARGGKSKAKDIPCLRKDGTIFYANIGGASITIDGLPCNVGFFSDITERKKAEAALRKSEEFNRRLLDHAPLGIVYLAGDGTIEYANPEANRITGIPEGQVSPVLGWNILELPGLQDRSRVQEDLRRLLEGEPLSNLEVPHKSSAGRDLVLLLSATPRFGSDGTVEGGILMFTDISEHKRAEELQRETARYRAVADLAGGVAHNFNNLLQIVIGYLEVALMDLEMGKYTDIKDSLEKVLESSKFGAETVRRLQSFASIRDRTQVPQRGVFDLSGILRQAVEMTKTWWKVIPEKQGRKVSLDIHLQDGCLILCEKNELFEVAVSLIKNAVEALTQDGAIEVETRVEGDWVILKVRDTGVGIREQNLKRLFNPFFTTKADAGAGLALASSLKIIEACGGNILADSSEGKGTTFTVVLPLAKEEPKPPRTEKTLATVQQLTVLAIDDENAMLDMLKNALTRYNFEVFTALSGEQGLDIFKRNPVELVICDLGMPGMTGWEVGKRIRAICQERSIKETPFILLTGLGGQKTEVEKMTECGVDAVLEKPLNIQNMLEAVREVVKKSQSRNSEG